MLLLLFISGSSKNLFSFLLTPFSFLFFLFPSPFLKVIKEENGKEDKNMKKFLKEGQRKRRLLDWNGHWHPRAVWIIEDRLQKSTSKCC